ncbi:hypothetical protein Nepgr_031017 [Nepenthes gracilis]|uniref:Uncharacterized protein n=1 Tax=Nepenthes gracilis TaxID=150966 RepID=A0AAD3Y6M6_NEPGR|nr:hypothetical protein Nepgr_031017 [Nepenthes gracilis]
MDANGRDAIIKTIGKVEGEKGGVGIEREEKNESKSLLPTQDRGMVKWIPRTRRKVQWNDTNGNKLAEVLEFQPSDASDNDEEEADSCFCTIM